MIPVYCPLCCDQAFEDQQSLFFHLRGIRNNLFCPICSERFSSLEFLVSHLSRKCYGPLSVAEAKKKCLSNATVNNELIDSKVNSKLIEASQKANDTTPNKKLNLSLSYSEDKLITNAHGSTEELNSPSIIPADIKKKLGKFVTLSVSSPLKQSPNKNDREKHLSIQSKPSLSITPATAKSTSLPKPEPFVKPGPLSMKLKAKTAVDSDRPTSNTSSPSDTRVVTSSVDSTSLRCPRRSASNIQEREIEENSILGKTRGPLQQEKTTQKDCYTINSSPNITDSPTQSLPKRGRGRPRKKPLDTIQSSSLVNGLVSEKETRKSGKESEETPQIKVLKLSSIEKMLGLGSSSKSQLEENSILDKVKSSNNSSINTQKMTLTEKENSMDTDDDIELNLEYHEEDSSESSDNANQEKAKDQDNADTTNDLSLLKEKTETQVEENIVNGEVDPKVEEEEEYTCSACNIRFTSIYEHIKEYHNGEEVVVEVPEEEIKEDLKAYQNEGETNVAITDVSSTSDIEKKEVPTRNKPGPKCKKVSENVKPAANKSTNMESLVKMAKKPVESKKKCLYTKYTKPYGKAWSACGKWLQMWRNKDSVYSHFIKSNTKLQILWEELKLNQSIHVDFRAPVQQLFENPSITLVAITNKPNTPLFTHQTVNFKKPVLMYVVERQLKESGDVLGGIASYVIPSPVVEDKACVPNECKLIAVMKVILASDKLLTVENVVFKEKPINENMIPILEDVLDPEIPLLKKAKMVKWKCIKCLSVTWMFPLTKDAHVCSSCPMCHKSFATTIALKKHMLLHLAGGSKFCPECYEAFSDRTFLSNHQSKHESHSRCPACNLLVPKETLEHHSKEHSRRPFELIPCSMCKKVLESEQGERKHEVKLCPRQVAKHVCSKCGKKFFSANALSVHSQVHKNITINFPCRFCTKTFVKEKGQRARKAGMRQPSGFIQKIWHERIHTRQRPYFCSQCPKRFRSPVHQTSHILYAHQGSTRREVDLHGCGVCNQVFPNSQQLTTHTQTHQSANT